MIVLKNSSKTSWHLIKSYCSLSPYPLILSLVLPTVFFKRTHTHTQDSHPTPSLATITNDFSTTKWGVFPAALIVCRCSTTTSTRQTSPRKSRQSSSRQSCVHLCPQYFRKVPATCRHAAPIACVAQTEIAGSAATTDVSTHVFQNWDHRHVRPAFCYLSPFSKSW